MPDGPGSGASPAPAVLGLLERVGALDLQRAGLRPRPIAGQSPPAARRAFVRRSLLPPGIADARSRAVVALLDRFDALDLAPVLVYHIDTVPAAALYALAWQFGVLGAAGWDLADTEAKRRELLRNAVELHRHAGTPWVIKRVLGALGYAVTIDEGVGRPTYDGAARRDGTIDRSAGEAWALFRVVLGGVPDTAAIDGPRMEQVAAVVEAWMPARSQLTGVVIDAPLPTDRGDAAPRDGDWLVEAAEYFGYDGALRHDGAAPHGPSIAASTLAS